MASLKSCAIPVLLAVSIVALVMMSNGRSNVSEGFTPVEFFTEKKENFGQEDTEVEDSQDNVVLKSNGPTSADYDFIKQCKSSNKHIRSHLTVQASASSCLDPPPENSSFQRIDGDVIRSALLDCAGNPPPCLQGRKSMY